MANRFIKSDETFGSSAGGGEKVMARRGEEGEREGAAGVETGRRKGVAYI